MVIEASLNPSNAFCPGESMVCRADDAIHTKVCTWWFHSTARCDILYFSHFTKSRRGVKAELGLKRTHMTAELAEDTTDC